MVEALLAVITVLVIALCILVGVTIYLHGSKSSLEDDKEELGYIIANYRKTEEKRIESLLGGIDGVTSVSLATKRYVELLKAENDLAELKEKVSELDNG